MSYSNSKLHELNFQGMGTETLSYIVRNLYEIPTKNLDNALHELTDMVKGFIFTNVSHSK